jgi:predicted MPP superfamily phosphohydrolase
MKNTVKRIGWGLLLVLGGLLLYGVFIEPRFLLEVEREEARVPALPAAWEGQQVAVLGDFQVGLFLDNTRAMREAVERVIAARPALVLIVGDFIYDVDADEVEEQIAEALPFFRPLVDAGLPTFAVLGNHDYGIATPTDEVELQVADTLESALEALGIPVLRNCRTGAGARSTWRAKPTRMGGSSPATARPATRPEDPRAA